MGVHPEHLHLVEAHPKRIPAMTELLRREIAHHGLSVVIARRECLETARRDKRGAS
jgi:indolepyruvate ferredoxin oxidoreductase alpha subunit